MNARKQGARSGRRPYVETAPDFLSAEDLDLGSRTLKAPHRPLNDRLPSEEDNETASTPGGLL